MVVLIVDFVECFSINVKNIQIDKRRKKNSGHMNREYF